MPVTGWPLAPRADTCELVLDSLLTYRRTEERDDHPGHARNSCFLEQFTQIDQFVADDLPILFTLPAFPCKSPNPDKVLGHLPDLGERAALRFLQNLCRQIEKAYPPGAKVLICSDGHVFGDLIHVPDSHISEYSAGLRAMIEDEGHGSLETFSLEHVYGDASFDEKRRLLTEQFAGPLESLREEVRSDSNTLSLYRGITRFLVDDTHKASEYPSKSALQRDCRVRAYGVIQRSRAWSDLISKHYPMSVRLSIHPQPCRSPKLGIMLLESTSSWVTPWHSAAVLQPDGSLTLMKRSEAEKAGQPVIVDGRPSHYVAA
jgi:L-tyrosine isonitrile synthase